MLHIYKDAAHTQQIDDNYAAGVGPDTYEGNGTTGMTTTPVKRYVWNDASATRRYEGITVTAVNDDANVNYQYAPDNAGSPGTWADSIALADSDFATAVPFWVRVIFAASVNPVNRTDIDHQIQIAREYAK